MNFTIFYCKRATFPTILFEALCGADVCKANSQQQIASNLRRFLLEKATRRRHATSALAHEVAPAPPRQIKIDALTEWLQDLLPKGKFTLIF